MNESDLYIQPSRHEGFGLTVLEAIFLKKIVLVSDIPVLKEQIKNNVNGFVFRLNPENLSETIMKVYNNGEIKNKIISNMNSQQEKMEMYNKQMSLIDCLVEE